jgi:hypothetical protein
MFMGASSAFRGQLLFGELYLEAAEEAPQMVLQK